MVSSDAKQVIAEFQVIANMLRHGAKRLLFILEDQSIDKAALRDELVHIEHQYRAQWLARNRYGGLEDSIARLVKLRGDYLMSNQ